MRYSMTLDCAFCGISQRKPRSPRFPIDRLILRRLSHGSATPSNFFVLRKKYKPLAVLGCTRLNSCRFVNVIFHLARTADKTTDFLSGSRKGKDEETASMTLRKSADVIPSASLQRYLLPRSVSRPPSISARPPPVYQCCI